MADGNGTGALRLSAEEAAHLDMVASRADLSGALARYLDHLVTQMEMAPADAAARMQRHAGIPPEERESDQISWIDLGELMKSEPERGERVWQRIKDDARLELARGVRSSRTVEPKVGNYPIHRARFSVIVQALSKSLQPRDALEELLIHQMASAYELHLHWQECASDRAKQAEWEGDRDRRREWDRLSPAQQERYALDHGWMPPRVSTAEAIDQAVMIADRYQRSFLRMMKAYRDNRRLISTLVVTGGQVNVGEQQINVATNGVFNEG